VQVDEQDLLSLTFSLGNTVGDRDDVKSLLPLLLERLVASDELDPAIVLGILPREQWRTWPHAEQDAVDGYLTTVWRWLLAAYPPQVGSFLDAPTFLDAVAATGEEAGRCLDIWSDTPGSAADRHLADAVNGLNFASRKSGTWTDGCAATRSGTGSTARSSATTRQPGPTTSREPTISSAPDGW
jgi:hypothetical protein